MANFDLLACARMPRIPVTQIGERHGSGKITLNKSGASGTRIWQVPWHMYPRFCDWLLGRVAPNPNGFPQLHRPDTFSPCYPWLHCQEVSVEGEDLLGLDASLRAFYRRAIVTAKYMPLEQGNSIHINSQMLTIPGSQYVFTGPYPAAQVGQNQTWNISLSGRPRGGGFKLTIMNMDEIKRGNTQNPPRPAAASTYTTELIPYNATPAQLNDAVRKALGLKTAAELARAGRSSRAYKEAKAGDVFTGGGRGGPWFLSISRTDEHQIIYNQRESTIWSNSNHDAAVFRTKAFDDNDPWWESGPLSFNDAGQAALKAEFEAAETADAMQAARDKLRAAGEALGYRYSTDQFGELTAHRRIDKDFRGMSAALSQYGTWHAFELVGRPQGTFRLRATFSDGSVAHSSTINLEEMTPAYMERAMQGIVSGVAITDNSFTQVTGSSNGQVQTRTIRQTRTEPAYEYTVWVTNAYIGGVEQTPAGEANTAASRTANFWRMSSDPLRPVRFYMQVSKTRKAISTLEVVDATFNTPPLPQAVVEKTSPNLADRLDQNVGKVVPMGEITIQRHQVLAIDVVYLLKVVGCVNMFTFKGFPPWTLLLSGIEAKETRLPNGTPAFDMTFKFAFNPHTHQALFRPARMRWEFVRGILQVTVPNNIAMPTRPLDPQSNLAETSDRAVKSAYRTPNAPRSIRPALDSRTGKAVKRPPEDQGGGGDWTDDGGGGWGARGPRGGQAPQKLGVGEGGVGSEGEEDLFGTLSSDDSGEEAAELLEEMDDGVDIDPDQADEDGGYDPIDVWEAQAQALGELTSKSVSAETGTSGDDQAASASGVAADILQAEEEGADWLDALSTGTDTSGNEGALGGNPEAALAAARNAARCGVPPEVLAAEGGFGRRDLLGAGPVPVADGGGGDWSDDGGGGDWGGPRQGQPAPRGMNPPTQSAVNVGAATSIRNMATRVFDLGYIYPIADMTPILWMQ